MSDDRFAQYTLAYERTGNRKPDWDLAEKQAHVFACRRPWLPTRKDAKILDFGCGWGNRLLGLWCTGYRNLEGVELVPEQVQIAMECAKGRVTIACMDGRQYLADKEDAYDLIMLNDVFEHVPPDDALPLLACLYRALRPGGTLVIRVPNMANLFAAYSRYLDITHVVGYTEYSLMQILDQAGFLEHRLVLPTWRIDFRRWRPWAPWRGISWRARANHLLHKILYWVRGYTQPQCFEHNVEIYTRKAESRDQRHDSTSKSHGLKVSVAIPTYNRERVLVDTIEQVLAQDPPADEVLVIDQTSAHEPETEEYLAKTQKAGRIRWIKDSLPNLNKARNRALWETSCDVVIFVDDDVDLAPRFVEMHACNYSDSSIVAVAGRTVQAHGNVPAATTMPWVRACGLEPFALDGTSRIEGVASFIGANHSVRVAAIRAIGGYDEHFFGPLYNESDLALRLWRAGHLIVFDPEAELVHLGIPTGGCRKASKANPEYWMSFSTAYFHMKHFFPRWYFWKQVFFAQFRRRALRREIIFHPWRLPWAVASYAYSIVLGTWIGWRHRTANARLQQVVSLGDAKHTEPSQRGAMAGVGEPRVTNMRPHVISRTSRLVTRRP